MSREYSSSSLSRPDSQEDWSHEQYLNLLPFIPEVGDIVSQYSEGECPYNTKNGTNCWENHWDCDEYCFQNLDVWFKPVFDYFITEPLGGDPEITIQDKMSKYTWLLTSEFTSRGIYRARIFNDTYFGSFKHCDIVFKNHPYIDYIFIYPQKIYIYINTEYLDFFKQLLPDFTFNQTVNLGTIVFNRTIPSFEFTTRPGYDTDSTFFISIPLARSHPTLSRNDRLQATDFIYFQIIKPIIQTIVQLKINQKYTISIEGSLKSVDMPCKTLPDLLMQNFKIRYPFQELDKYGRPNKCRKEDYNQIETNLIKQFSFGLNDLNNNTLFEPSQLKLSLRPYSGNAFLIQFTMQSIFRFNPKRQIVHRHYDLQEEDEQEEDEKQNYTTQRRPIYTVMSLEEAKRECDQKGFPYVWKQNKCVKTRGEKRKQRTNIVQEGNNTE